jgi:uncharacterized protein (DUF1684 family)
MEISKKSSTWMNEIEIKVTQGDPTLCLTQRQEEVSWFHSELTQC